MKRKWTEQGPATRLTDPSGSPLIVHAWSIYFHPLFLDQLERLIAEVEALERKDPVGYRKRNPTKRLAALNRLVFDVIPQDPTRPEYRQGDTLGSAQRHWFRAKFFQQYRLFFRFHSQGRIIVFAWVNDEGTLRAYGRPDDAYPAFAGMLEKGRPPAGWAELLKESLSSGEHAQRLRPPAPPDT